MTPYPADTLKVVHYRDIAFRNFVINPKLGLQYADSALQLSKKIHWIKGEILGNNAFGANYWAIMDYQRAIHYYQQSYRLARQLNDRNAMVHARIQIGTCYTGLNRFDKALTEYETSLGEARQINNTQLMISCHFNMAYCLKSLNRQEESLRHLQFLLSLPSVRSNPEQKAVVHGNFIELMILRKKIPEGLAHADTLLSIGQQLKAKNLLADAFKCRGDLLAALNRMEPARQSLEESIRIMGKPKEHAAIGQLAILWNTLAKTYFNPDAFPTSHNNLTKAREAYQQAARLANSIKEWQILSTAYQGLYQTEKEMGLHNEALKSYASHIASRDSITNLEKENLLRRTELDHEFAKWQDSLNIVNRLQKEQLEQQQENSKLKHEQTLLGWAISIILVMAIAGILLFVNRLQKLRIQHALKAKEQQAALKEAEFQSKMNDLMLNGLKSQMNPHFLFNCLTSITLLIEEKNLDSAIHYLSKFSQLIRYTLDSSSNESIPLSREVEMLKLYLDLESMRFKEKLNYTISLDGELDDELTRIPHMIIQPFVENAIRHGLMHKPDGGRIRIAVQQIDGNRLQVKVEDNGIGRQHAAAIHSVKNPLRTSFGTRLLQERINLINQKYNAEHLIHTEDLHDPEGKACGTRVTIIIPML